MDGQLTFDLMARDQSFSSTLAQAAKSPDKLAQQVDAAGKKISSDMEASFKKAGKSGIYIERAADGTAKAWGEAVGTIDRSFDAALKAASSDMDRMEQNAFNSSKGISKAFSTALKDARSELGRLRTEGARTGDGLESSLGQALKGVKKDMHELEEAGKDAGEGIGSSLTEGLSSVLDKSGGGPLAGLLSSFSGAKLGMAGAGLAIGGLLMDGIADAIERRKVGALVAAQTGQVAGSASRMGNIAGDLFSQSFGESVQDVGPALTAVLQNHLIDPNAADSAIASITGKIMTISDVMDEEANNVARAVQRMLQTGLASNISQAMDMIQHATETGMNSAGDLIDTISEYGTQFRKVGLDGADAFGLIGQAMKAGARDSDIAADAIKEFSIRAVDGSDLTRRGFEAVGLDAGKMSARITAGGDTAKQALRETLNALQEMPPSVERSTAAVDLFGTQAEDLGDALFHMDLDNASSQFGDFAGSVSEAANRMGEGVTGAEKLGKGFDNAKADVGDFLFELGNVGSSGLDQMTGKFQELGLAIQKWASSGDTRWLDEVKQKYPELSGAIDQYIAKHRSEVEANNAVSSSVQEQVDTLDELIAKKQEAAGITLSARESERQYQAAVDAASESVKKNSGTHNDNTQAGRENNAALDDIAKTALDVAASMAAEGRTTAAVNKTMNVARNTFVATARSMGYTKGEAQALATKLGLIPGDYKAQVRALGIANAKAQVQGIINKINAIPNYVDVRVNIHGNEMAAAGIPTGGFNRRARGGPVRADEVYRVGEEGEELFVPNKDGMIIPNDALRAGASVLSPNEQAGKSGGRASNVNVHMHIHGSSSMAEAIKTDVRKGNIRFEVVGNRVKVA